MVDQVTHGNAMKHFNYDPFSTLGGREQCNVGALRAKAVDHDIAIRSVGASTSGHANRALDLAVPET
jgi:hypothetical protein